MKELAIPIPSLFSMTSCDGPLGITGGSLTYESSESGPKLPDSGAKVSLFSLDPKVGKRSAGTWAAGKEGRFILEGIPPGSYFYIIESGNAIPCPAHVAYHLKLYRQELQLVFGLDASRYESWLMGTGRAA